MPNNYRLTRTDTYGGDKDCPGKNNTGARNGLYSAFNSPEEAVLSVYARESLNPCEPLDVECDGTYIGRYRSRVIDPQDVHDIVKMPPTPTVLAEGVNVACQASANPASIVTVDHCTVYFDAERTNPFVVDFDHPDNPDGTRSGGENSNSFTTAGLAAECVANFLVQSKDDSAAPRHAESPSRHDR